MGRFRLRHLTLALALVAAVALLTASSAAAQEVQHGISFTKGCTSPTAIGDPYTCSFSVRNNVDEAEDTLTISSLEDVVHSAGGNVSTGAIFSSLKLDNCSTSSGTCTQTAAACTGGSITGTGTRADPWTNATLCTLPFGSRINIQSFSHYTVQAADYGLPSHQLTDDASLHWNDLCDDPANTGNTNCNPNPPNTTAAGQADITKLASSTTTDIHNAAHTVVTTVEVGTIVHDFVTVTGQPSKPIPTGNVNIDWFLNGTCAGSAAANSGSIGPLDSSGLFDATGFTQTPTSAGKFGFKGHYEGDATYASSDGPCEPLTVVDANIQITPATDTNPVGANHTVTCHINVNDGTGFTNAPANTTCTISIVSGPGTPSSQNCNTVGVTGQCTAVITSSVTGTTVIRAATNVTVGGLSLHRETNDAKTGDSSDAEKLWADDVVTTNVRNASNGIVTNTTIPAGTVVHDEAIVAKAAGTPAAAPNPTGTVDFTLYDNGSCNGNVLATDANKPLSSGSANSATFTTPSAGGTFSYLAHYDGNANYPAHDGPCEPFTVSPAPSAPALTPGFWKNHEAATTALLPVNLGNYVVDTFAKARAIFDAMKCSAPINCLAGHLLAAVLDVKSGSDPSINPTLAKANAFLSGGSADGVTGVNYTGPGSYTLTAAQKAEALSLEATIDAYTNA